MARSIDALPDVRISLKAAIGGDAATKSRGLSDEAATESRALGDALPEGYGRFPESVPHAGADEPGTPSAARDPGTPFVHTPGNTPPLHTERRSAAHAWQFGPEVVDEAAAPREGHDAAIERPARLAPGASADATCASQARPELEPGPELDSRAPGRRTGGGVIARF